MEGKGFAAMPNGPMVTMVNTKSFGTPGLCHWDFWVDYFARIESREELDAL
jgi:hypothetical protein